MKEEKKYVYLYKRGNEEFITGSYQLAVNRNQSNDLYVIDILDGLKYLLTINEN